MNKKIGNDTELIIAKLFKEYGYWCHIFNSNYAGQPVDLVAIKNYKVWLCDVKHCDKPYFLLSRVEPNQWDTMQYAKECGIKRVGVIAYYNNEAFYIDYNALKRLKDENIKRVYILNCERVVKSL